jgi:hypothetical protein
MSALAKVPPRHTAPLARPEPPYVPHECPRCGASLDRSLREVDLAMPLDDGAEMLVTGYECARCGWCCIPDL